MLYKLFSHLMLICMEIRFELDRLVTHLPAPLDYGIIRVFICSWCEKAEEERGCGLVAV